MKRMKIKVSTLNQNIINFLELSNLETISETRLINRFQTMYAKDINIMSRKLHWLYTKNNIEYDEIKNQLLICFWDLVIDPNSLSQPYGNFKSYFWQTIKLNLLNRFNKMYNTQYSFESTVSYNKTNLASLSQKIARANIDVKNNLTLDNLKRFLTSDEMTYLNNKLNCRKQLLSNHKQSEMLQNIKKKIQLYL